LPLGATLAEGAGAALADGAAEALGAPGVGDGALEPQLSHPASETRTTGMESSMSRRTRTSLELTMVTRVLHQLSFLAFSLVLAFGLVHPAHAATPTRTTVRVLVPDGDNLQYLAFWAAEGAGYFDEEGIDIDLLVPDVPAQAIAKAIAAEAPVGVMPPPQYLELIADRVPIVLVANLLRNDPINLVVRRSIFEQRAMNPAAPLRDRLMSLQGLRIGVAPGPPTRLRALFASVGLDADSFVKIVIRHGKDQNEAFAHDECDALFAHTPYLEKALDDQDAVMLVNQSGGDVPELAMRQIHALVARREYLDTHRNTVVGMTRALARAEKLVHADLAATEEAVMRALPSLERRHVHTLLRVYQPAVPEAPLVGTDGLAPALALFPASRTPPSLEGIPLADFVDPTVLAEAMGAAPAPKPPAARAVRPPATWLSLAVGACVGLVVYVLLRRKGGSQDHQEPKPSASSRTG
jgi:ABC-type nitrate/sulfonate/bicarbonate transport system substrate-binding protein